MRGGWWWRGGETDLAVSVRLCMKTRDCIIGERETKSACGRERGMSSHACVCACVCVCVRACVRALQAPPLRRIARRTRSSRSFSSFSAVALMLLHSFNCPKLTRSRPRVSRHARAHASTRAHTHTRHTRSIHHTRMPGNHSPGGRSKLRGILMNYQLD